MIQDGGRAGCGSARSGGRRANAAAELASQFSRIGMDVEAVILDEAGGGALRRS
jgi:hypothetical protein